MTKLEIQNYLNEKYKGQFIFSLTDSENEIVGFVDDGEFKNIICVLEPTEDEMLNFVKHVEKNTK